MPELPEVETVKRDLEKNNIVGRKITRVDILWKKSAVPENLSALILNKKITAIGRKGKYLYFILCNKHYLFFHLRMSGKIFLNSSLKSHDRVIIFLSGNMKISFNDTRKFGRITYHEDPFIIFNKLGPEPIDTEFSYKYLKPLFHQSKKTIKAMLLDQKIIAGMGNIYVDEALFEANLHPEQKAGGLTDKQLKKLVAAARKVIRKGIRNKGTSLGSGKTNFYSPANESGKNQETVKVYGRTLEPCVVCRHTIEKIKVAGRGTHFCPECQKLNS